MNFKYFFLTVILTVLLFKSLTFCQTDTSFSGITQEEQKSLFDSTMAHFLEAFLVRFDEKQYNEALLNIDSLLVFSQQSLEGLALSDDDILLFKIGLPLFKAHTLINVGMPKESEEACNLLLEKVTNDSIDKSILKSIYFCLGLSQYYQQAYEEANTNFENSFKNETVVYFSNNYSSDLIKDYALNLEKTGRYEKAIEVFEQLIVKDGYGEADEINHGEPEVYKSHIANIYRILGRYDEALELQMEVIETSKSFSELQSISGRFFLNLALIYEDLNQPENSLMKYNEALDSARKHKDTLAIYLIKKNLGSFYFYDNELESDIIHLDSALYFIESTPLKFEKAYVQSILARCYLQINDIKTTQKLLNEIKPLLKNQRNLYYKSYILETFAKFHEISGDNGQALIYLKKAHSAKLKDRDFSKNKGIEREHDFLNEKTRFENRLNESIETIKDNIKEIVEKEDQIKRRNKIILTGSLLLGILVFILGFIRKKHKNISQQIQNLESYNKSLITALRLFSEDEISQEQVLGEKIHIDGNREIFLKDIFYLKAKGNTTIFFTSSGIFQDLSLLKIWESKLVETGAFIRVHNSWVVNLTKIKRSTSQFIKLKIPFDFSSINIEIDGVKFSLGDKIPFGRKYYNNPHVRSIVKSHNS